VDIVDQETKRIVQKRREENWKNMLVFEAASNDLLVLKTPGNGK